MIMFRRRRVYSGNGFRHPSRIVVWAKAHKKVLIPGALAILILVSVGATALYKTLDKQEKPAAAKQQHKQETAKKPEAPKFYSPLTGLEVTKEQSEKPVTAIMIENSPDARPQSGMIDAGVIFEAVAEGGITRFQVLYQELGPMLIGPVRSLRPYYLEWAAAFDPAIVHIGGSANALKEVRNGSHKDADQFFNAQYFWRATDRYAPHNVYTSFEKLNEMNKAKGFTKSKFTSFPRKKDGPVKVPTASSINVNVSSYLYNSSYLYDKASNSYRRSEGGELHMDRESKKQLSPKVVVVMKVEETTVLEDGYRQSIKAIGSGEAIIFQDGQAIVGTWQKPGMRDQITFKDAGGKPINLVAGQTWITAIPKENSVTWQP